MNNYDSWKLSSPWDNDTEICECDNCQKKFHEDDLELIEYVDECGTKFQQDLCEDCRNELAPRWGKD